MAFLFSLSLFLLPSLKYTTIWAFDAVITNGEPPPHKCPSITKIIRNLSECHSKSMDARNPKEKNVSYVNENRNEQTEVPKCLGRAQFKQFFFFLLPQKCHTHIFYSLSPDSYLTKFQTESDA